ncbi:dipeptidase [Deinococcus sp. QL22]|uniref:dipeptidase n=1 Tax=Deinococcus sp. QL22 TaxID=2939437 RepID=UPI002016C6A0|nr:membrane dipeptidase [Deinococcus sp. QL22]UQN06053.1 membrane dipeptidase [Deinococcus sp. QL22]
MLIDGHLDLAFNAALGRDLTLPLADLRRSDPVAGETATVTFPEMQAAGLRVCFGTLFALPRTDHHPIQSPDGYTDHAGARRQALGQLEQYRRWEDDGHLRLLRTGAEVAAHVALEGAPPGVVLLMEGADPVRDVDDLAFWAAAGVRVIGPAWGRTRYAGGTEAPGPLTAAGRELVGAMASLGIALDASHLDDASFWDAAELHPRMIATHANSRSIVEGNRHLTDDMARAIAEKDGVIGLVYPSKFLQPGWQDSDPRAPLGRLADHAQHYAGLIGWERVALGTDLDGGFGQEKCPAGVDSYRDVPGSVDVLPAEVRRGVLGENWARWMTRYL